MTIQAREIDEQAAKPCDPPRRVQLSRAKGWRMPKNTVKVDRSTKWGNPYRPGHNQWSHALGKVIETVEEAVITFRWDAERRMPPHFGGEDLRGKNLACWCPLDAPWCHADVLLQIANSTSRRVARS